jgi:hypothetical protein
MRWSPKAESFMQASRKVLACGTAVVVQAETLLSREAG